MTKEERLKKCETIYDLWHIEGKAIETALMMCDFAMRFRNCVLIYPEMYNMFYDYIKTQPYERNSMHSILRNLEEIKHRFKPNSEREDKHTFWDTKGMENKRLDIDKNKPSLYNPIMMLSRLNIDCVECACDPNVWETRRPWFNPCKHK